MQIEQFKTISTNQVSFSWIVSVCVMYPFETPSMSDACRFIILTGKILKIEFEKCTSKKALN